MLTLTFISPKEHLNSDKVLFFNRSPYSLRFFTFRVWSWETLFASQTLFVHSNDGMACLCMVERNNGRLP